MSLYVNGAETGNEACRNATEFKVEGWVNEWMNE